MLKAVFRKPLNYRAATIATNCYVKNSKLILEGFCNGAAAAN